MNRLAIGHRGEPKINVILTPKGLERISILGGIEATLEAMTLYSRIADDVLKIDRKLRKLAAENFFDGRGGQEKSS